MIRNISSANIQAVSVQATEKAEDQSAVSTQPQPAEVKNAPATTASSVNTWQRASLIQDGAAQQKNLIEQSYQHAKEEIAQAKASNEDKPTGALFGSIFGGLLIGTHIGNPIGTQANSTEPKKGDLRDMLGKMEEEVKQLQEQLKEVQDNSFVETFGDWLTGNDGGQSEIAEATNQNPSKDLHMEVYTKVQHDPDDD